MEDSESDAENREKQRIQLWRKRTVKVLHVPVKHFTQRDACRKVHLTAMIDDRLSPSPPGSNKENDVGEPEQTESPRVRQNRGTSVRYTAFRRNGSGVGIGGGLSHLT